MNEGNENIEKKNKNIYWFLQSIADVADDKYLHHNRRPKAKKQDEYKNIHVNLKPFVNLKS